MPTASSRRVWQFLGYSPSKQGARQLLIGPNYELICDELRMGSRPFPGFAIGKNNVPLNDEHTLSEIDLDFTSHRSPSGTIPSVTV